MNLFLLSKMLELLTDSLMFYTSSEPARSVGDLPTKEGRSSEGATRWRSVSARSRKLGFFEIRQNLHV